MDTKHPDVSPIYGDLRLPPMLVFAAGLDLLTPDTRKMVDIARKEGTRVELVYGEDMVHVWPLLPITTDDTESMGFPFWDKDEDFEEMIW
uniref:WGS project CBMG000000000 data, contig CS5907-c001849 n=1 Tax=Fusarium acuminatum CS5907 TaxID=1318461 RepID=A0A090N507_9HYPO|nr:unnamed protein product [Fusarium acuminatum CS5907]